jgi:uncharacterized protein (TIGR02186 family)
MMARQVTCQTTASILIGLLIGLMLLLAPPAMAAPKQIVADLSNSRVDITSSYHGTELLLFGAYEGMPGDDIILVVQGPATDIIQRRKAKRAGIWVNVETKVWQEEPSFYHVFATGELPSIADEQALSNATVGPLADGLSFTAGRDAAGNGHGGGDKPAPAGPAIASTLEQQNNLRRNMEANGLWQVLPSSIVTQQDMLFRASLSLPSNIPTGDYSVRVLHFRDGVALSERVTDMNVRKAGLSALIYRFAHEFSALYGIFAIIFAVTSGWLAAVAFRRK